MTALEVEQLKIKIYENRRQLGADAARMAAAKINELLNEKPYINVIFAAAASQNEFLQFLIAEPVDWTRVNAFHMDEYIGLNYDAPQRFGNWLTERIFSRLPFREVFYLNGQAKDIQGECDRYSALLRRFPVDITFMGIGENTHLAFNDPHVADFSDSALVKVVDLDEACKQQQVNEGCFENVEQVPALALTLTVPALIQAAHIYCMVPGETKAQAVFHTLTEAIGEKYPSTILRTHANAWLFLDKESAARILNEKDVYQSFKQTNIVWTTQQPL